RRLVPAARVERAWDLALAVENVAALLHAARDHHVAVDLKQVLPVEAPLLHVLERAARLGNARERHCTLRGEETGKAAGIVTTTCRRRAATVVLWARRPTGSARSGATSWGTGRPSASNAARPGAGSWSPSTTSPSAAPAAAGSSAAARPARRRSRRPSPSTARSAALSCAS